MKSIIRVSIFLFLAGLFSPNLFAQKIPPYEFNGITMGVKKSKFANGYVVLRNGQRINGEISISVKEKKRDTIAVRVITADGNKQEFERNMLANYGLDPVDDVREYKKGDGWYVKRHDGQMISGKLWITTVNGDTTQYRINTEEKQELVFRAADVADHGMIFESGRDFQKGTVQLKNGQTIEGWIDPWEEDHEYVTYLLVSTDRVTQKWIEQAEVERFSREKDGKVENYSRYKDGFVKHIIEGPATLARNPFPTTIDKGKAFMSKAGAFLIAATATEVAKDVTEKQGRKAAQKQASKGNIGGAMQTAVNTESKVASIEQTQREMAAATLGSAPSTKHLAKEYIIGIEGRPTIIINVDNCKTRMEKLLYELTPFYKLSKRERKHLTKFDNVEEAVKYYNANSPVKTAATKP